VCQSVRLNAAITLSFINTFGIESISSMPFQADASNWNHDVVVTDFQYLQ